MNETDAEEVKPVACAVCDYTVYPALLDGSLADALKGWEQAPVTWLASVAADETREFGMCPDCAAKGDLDLIDSEE